MDDAQTWRRVFSKMTSLQHESDDDALSFERLSNWQDTCISTRETETDRSQRTRRDSQFQNTHLYTRLEKQTELGGGSDKRQDHQSRPRRVVCHARTWPQDRSRGGSHSVYTSRPKEVAALIEDAATHAR